MPPPLCAVHAAGTASDPLFIAVVNQWGDAALLRKAKQDAADTTDRIHTVLIAGVADVGADARSSSFYLRTKGRNCVALEAVSSRPCRGDGAPVVIPARFKEDVRADFRAQNRLDFCRKGRIGVVMGWPSQSRPLKGSPRDLRGFGSCERQVRRREPTEPEYVNPFHREVPKP